MGELFFAVSLNNISLESILKLKKIRQGLFILFAVLILASAAACQPTPDEPIIAGKNDTELEEIIAATPAPVVGETADGTTEEAGKIGKLPVELETKGHWEDSVSVPNGEITIDADILLPQTAEIPVFRLEKGEITEADAAHIGEILFGDAKSVSVSGNYSKEQLQAIIIQYKKQISDLKENGSAPDSKEPVDEQIRELEEQLAQYEQMYISYDSSQSAYEQIPADYSFYLLDGADKSNPGLSYQVELQNGESAEFKIKKSSTGMRDTLSFQRDELVGLTKTLEECETYAADLIDKLDIGEFTLGSSQIVNDPNGSYALLWYNMAEYGIPFIEVSSRTAEVVGGMTEEELSNEQQDAFFEYISSEVLLVLIDDAGVYHLNWVTPWNVGKVENTNVSILSPEEAEAIFKEQIGYHFSSLSADEEVEITTVTLGYRYSRIKDAPGEYRAIPVYDFIGINGNDKKFGGEGGSYLTINAIDGSIFDTTKNY